MSPWTALLQSLHSAMIDEVTDRHPEPKPELGLPKRQSQFAFPSEKVSQAVWIDVSFGDSKGVALLAFNPPFLTALKLDSDALWNAMLKRAGAEFARRDIRPILGRLEKLTSKDPVPETLSSLPRIVWIPISVPEGECWFGIAA